jgi:branched-subunit amino acid aminotransferase/4-amino-4-deoxychorismate lyase
MERLEKACRRFSFSFDAGKVLQALQEVKSGLGAGKWKIRLCLESDGEVEVFPEKISVVTSPVAVTISPYRVDSRDPFLYYKTTRRPLYERERVRLAKEGFFDALFLNTRGEMTEGTITNLFIQLNGTLYTPPVGCGLLPGILRQQLIRAGRVKEKIILLEETMAAEKVYVGNSVRGLLEAQLTVGNLQRPERGGCRNERFSLHTDT